MSSRSTPQKQIDERAFPVRVVFALLPRAFMGLGEGRDPHRWLRENLGLGNAAIYGWRQPFVGEGYALYCRSVEDAAAFMAAFPELQIADGTLSEVYNSPHVSRGMRRGE